MVGGPWRIGCLVLALAVIGCTTDSPVASATDDTPAATSAPTTPSTTSPSPTSVPIRETCTPPPVEPTAGQTLIIVYQVCDATQGTDNRVLAGLEPVERVTADSDAPLRAAMEALLAGPTPEESAAGYGSWFSANTADAFLDASVTEDGLAMIDLEGDSILGIPNVSTITGGDLFRGQLYGTAFAIEETRAAGISIDGSTSAFCALMELIPDCTPITRAEWDEIYSDTFD